MTELKANFLTLVRQDTRMLERISMDEEPLGMANQVRFRRKMLDMWLSLEFLPNGKILIMCYRAMEPLEYVNTYNVQDAYRQVRYFSNSGKLKNAEAL